MLTFPQLRAHTTALPRTPELTEILTAQTGQLAWIKNQTGFVGAGIAARFDGSTPSSARFQLASHWWQDVLDGAEIRDEVGVRGSGLIAFGSFAFSDASPSGDSLIIPQVVVGISEGRSFLTIIGPTDRDVFDTLDTQAKDLLDAVLRGTSVATDDLGVVRGDFETSEEDYFAGLATIKEQIAAGKISKCVYARSMAISTEHAISERLIVRRLAHAYPNCWTFAIDGLIGATPELLAQTDGENFRCRVLAGSLPADTQGDLLNSTKDANEHKIAVDSVVQSLSKIGKITVSDPFILELPNVSHVATDIVLHLDFTANALEVAGTVHPTASLGGWPRLTALDLINNIEPDRDRYGAPVGWISYGSADESAQGEWCVSLRCARITGENQARAWAGGGIIAQSDPVAELAEVYAKFKPIRTAFGF